MNNFPFFAKAYIPFIFVFIEDEECVFHTLRARHDADSNMKYDFLGQAIVYSDFIWLMIETVIFFPK